MFRTLYQPENEVLFQGLPVRHRSEVRLQRMHSVFFRIRSEGYVTGIALDDHDEIIGYQFVNLGKMTDFIKAGDTPNDAWEKAKGQYGRVEDAVKIIDPRKE